MNATVSMTFRTIIRIYHTHEAFDNENVKLDTIQIGTLDENEVFVLVTELMDPSKPVPVEWLHTLSLARC